MIFKLLVKMQWGLDLDEGSELGIVVLNIIASLIIFFNECMLPTDRNVVDSYICLVSTTKFDLIDVVKVDNMQLLLLFMLVFR
jgi:hypothetical protein